MSLVFSTKTDVEFLITILYCVKLSAFIKRNKAFAAVIISCMTYNWRELYRVHDEYVCVLVLYECFILQREKMNVPATVVENRALWERDQPSGERIVKLMGRLHWTRRESCLSGDVSKVAGHAKTKS